MPCYEPPLLGVANLCFLFSSNFIPCHYSIPFSVRSDSHSILCSTTFRSILPYFFPGTLQLQSALEKIARFLPPLETRWFWGWWVGAPQCMRPRPKVYTKSAYHPFYRFVWHRFCCAPRNEQAKCKATNSFPTSSRNVTANESKKIWIVSNWWSFLLAEAPIGSRDHVGWSEAWPIGHPGCALKDPLPPPLHPALGDHLQSLWNLVDAEPHHHQFNHKWVVFSTYSNIDEWLTFKYSWYYMVILMFGMLKFYTS